MSFFDDAHHFIKTKHADACVVGDILYLDTDVQREAFKQELRRLYENATRTEIDRAVDWGMEQLSPPYDKSTFLKKIRPKLED